MKSTLQLVKDSMSIGSSSGVGHPGCTECPPMLGTQRAGLGTGPLMCSYANKSVRRAATEERTGLLTNLAWSGEAGKASDRK